MTKSHQPFDPEQIIYNITLEYNLNWKTDVIIRILSDFIKQYATPTAPPAFENHYLRAAILEKDHTIRRLREQR